MKYIPNSKILKLNINLFANIILDMVSGLNDVTSSILARTDIIDDVTSIKINDMADSESIEAHLLTERDMTSDNIDPSSDSNGDTMTEIIDDQQRSLPAAFVTRIISGAPGNNTFKLCNCE